MAELIRGINYNKKQTEYQYFPEEYFSGSDVSIYFGDTFVDEIMQMQFSMQERVTPIFGYNSYTYDAAARGQRVIQGSFTIAFREAGYLHRVLNHIGQMHHNARPKLAAELGGQTALPKWLAETGETIEELLDRAGGVASVKTSESATNWPLMQLGNKNVSVAQLQQHLLQNPAYTLNTDNITKNMSNNGLVGAGYLQSDPQVKVLKKKLNAYLYQSGSKLIAQPLADTSIFDAKTAEAVKLFQKHFSKTLAVDGVVGPATREVLNRGLSATGTYDAATKLAVMLYQKSAGLVVDGIFGEKSRGLVAGASEVGVAAETEYARYEADIWSGKSNFDTARKDRPFFYGNQEQAWLLSQGFDIFVNYGQLPQTRIQNGKVSDTITHNNTVKALRGVQLQGVQQVISPTGEAIAETYTFIAKDMD